MYYYSSDYRNFLKNAKNQKVEVEEVEESVEEEEGKKQLVIAYDKFNVKSKNDKFDNKKEEPIYNDNSKDKLDLENKEDDMSYELEDNDVFDDSEAVKEEIKVEYSSDIGELEMTKIEEKFLKIFGGYGLEKVSLHPRLFDLTAEYPDQYFEYYSEYLTLYFFGNKPYGEIKDVFEVLTFELPFSLNEVNNFGDKSFYINLDTNFEDGIVRVVLLYKNRTFGLKLNKDIYDSIKEKLNSLDK